MKETITNAIAKIEELSLQNDRLKQNETILVQALKNAQAASEPGLAEEIESLNNVLATASSAIALPDEEIEVIINPPEVEPEPSPYPEERPAGSTEIALMVEVPYFMAQGITLDTKQNGDVIVTNSTDYVYTATTNGQSFDLTMEGTKVGTADELNGRALTLSSYGKQSVVFYLVKK
jgi:hypothetical protein